MFISFHVVASYAGQNVKMGTSPWITHFHLNKVIIKYVHCKYFTSNVAQLFLIRFEFFSQERLLKERLNLKSISDVLNEKYRLSDEKSAENSSTMFPELHISRRYLYFQVFLQVYLLEIQSPIGF